MSLLVYVGTHKLLVEPGMFTTSLEFTLGLGPGGEILPDHVHRDAKWYPFVSLHFELWFMAFWTADNGLTALDLPLPLAVSLNYDFIPMYQLTSQPVCVFGGNDTSIEWTAMIGDIGINNIFRRYGVGG